MKKIFLYAVMLLCAGAASAQVVVSHPRDTISYPAPDYFFNHWLDSIDMIHPTIWCHTVQFDPEREVEMAAHFYTDTPLRIKGVAAAIWTGGERWSTYYNPCRGIWDYLVLQDSTFDNWTEYLRLYDATNAGLALLGEGAYNALDTARCMRCYYNIVSSLDSLAEPWWTDPDTVLSRIVPIYEVFFEEPITVTDSFYVASTNYHCILDSECYELPGWNAMLECVRTEYTPKPRECYPQRVYTRGRSGIECWYEDNYQLWIWAIYDTVPPQVDTCKAVSGLEVAQDSLAANVTWARGEFNNRWQVAYGRADADPDSYTPFTTTTEHYSIRHLTPGVEYAVRVRGNCFDDTTFSDWSDTVRFVRQGTPEGIGAALQPFTSVTPNPASNRVTVTSAFDIRRITFYDMQGHAVLDTEAEGLAATINVQDLPVGSYVVGILTRQGLSTRKVVIER